MHGSGRWIWSAAAAVTIGLAGAGEIAAQGGGRGGGGAPAGPPIPAYRVSLMQGYQLHVGAIRAVLSGAAGARSHLAGHANAIQSLATMAADAFPAGSGGPQTRARDEIWSNGADFSARLAALRSAADALAQAATGTDDAQINAALTTLNQSCQACHMAFRGPPPAN